MRFPEYELSVLSPIAMYQFSQAYILHEMERPIISQHPDWLIKLLHVVDLGKHAPTDPACPVCKEHTPTN